MFFTQITFFSKFGTVMFLTMFLSTVFSMLPLPAALMEIGPLRRQGMLSNFYGPYVKLVYSQLERDEEKEAMELAQAEAHGLTSNKRLVERQWGSAAASHSTA